MTDPVRCAAIALALATGCGAADPTWSDGVDGGVDAASRDAAWLAPVACGAALAGPALASGIIEDGNDYFAAEATMELAAVPDPLDYSAESAGVRGLVNYMLGRAEGDSVTREAALARGELGRAVLVASAMGAGGQLDLRTLRRGLHAAYPCSRPLPRTLDDLAARFGDYHAWPAEEIRCARPKNGPRRLHVSPDGRVYVAETVVAGEVRETEVLFEGLRDDGQLDFAAYAHDGTVSDRSTFATVGGTDATLAAPITCMGCHVSRGGGLYDEKRPDGTGAGCR